MALSRHHAAVSRPLNVEEITREGDAFEFSTHRSLQQWLRAAKMLLNEAAMCEEDGNYQMAYLYRYRHCQLILTKLPAHPEYRDERYKDELARARREVMSGLKKMEAWKPRIIQEYQRYVKAMERRNAERQRVQEECDQFARGSQAFDGSRRGSLASLGGAQSLNANENREFAVDLAEREIRRRDASRRSTKQAGISPSVVASRRQGFIANDVPGDDYSRTSDGVREAGRYLQREPHRSSRDYEPQYRQRPSSSYHYPTVPQREARMEWNESTWQHPPPSRPRQEPPPARPAKESLYDYRATELPSRDAPALPPKSRYSPPPHSPPTASPSPPPASHQPSGAKYTFKPTAFTESGSPLRTVLLPPDLRTAFLNLAHENTLRNLETCGILCATLISNALFITHLIVPDQTSTSDTCDTTEEGDNALFDFCDSHNLLVCGWIHTHPSQSCFLSSRDLHTSSGYQVMLPEAIAIVCAPRYLPDWGIFRLTEPPGLEHILGCEQKGLFHPHAEEDLYTDALRPGHVVEGPGLKFEVVDLRM
ncbi:AMSH-like protease sst2 [Lecanosticta acicola]|uniref:AMSH-like protease sst2 n=1 Tax=Lecanosticta acicola TaxID=111012 RepID=A0AAI8Z1H3_9PEZI|nr:AMSH-like protease sst2 [Lecanosticta acicola]